MFSKMEMLCFSGSTTNQNRRSMVNIIKDTKGRTLYNVAVDLLLISGNKVLLQRRANTGWNDGKWNLIGGHIEDDENWEQALAREAKEELGISIDTKDLQMVHCMQHKTDRLTMQFYMTCSKYQGLPEIQPEIINGTKVYKADKIDWFELNDLPKELIPSAKQAITAYEKKESFSQLGFEKKLSLDRNF